MMEKDRAGQHQTDSKADVWQNRPYAPSESKRRLCRALDSKGTTPFWERERKKVT